MNNITEDWDFIPGPKLDQLDFIRDAIISARIPGRERNPTPPRINDINGGRGFFSFGATGFYSRCSNVMP